MSSSQSQQEFYITFQASRSAIVTRLDEAQAQAQPSPDLIAQIAQSIQAERKKFNEATAFLPSYDRRSYESQLQQLETRIEGLRRQNVSNKNKKGEKFTFKKSTGTAPSTPRPPTQPPIATTTHTPTPPDSTPPSKPTLQLSSTSHQYFTTTSLSLSPPHQSPVPSQTSDLTISSLTHCIIDILPSTGIEDTNTNEGTHTNLNLTALHIRDVKNSILLLGHIHGSVMVHNLERCIVVVACHQLRIHNTHNTRFHLHVSSNAIIEDSTSLTFAPYPSTLPLPPEVRHQKSRHNTIQDFSHLKPTPSPNWRTIPDPDLDTTTTTTIWPTLRSSARDALTPTPTPTPTLPSPFDVQIQDQDQNEKERHLTSLLENVLPPLTQ